MTETAAPWTIAESLLAPLDCRVVFDVGAHDGGMTDLFLRIFARAQLFSFEPDPDVFAALAQRFAHEPRVSAQQVALGDREGSTVFFRGAATFTSSRFPRNATGRRYYRKDYVMRETLLVPMTTLDAFAKAREISRIHLLKLDTQGGELDILEGAVRLLTEGRIDVIVTEFFVIPHYGGAPLLPEIWSLLKTHGYELYDLFPGPRGVNGQLRYGDAIFVSAAFRHAYLDTAPPEP